MKNRKTIGSFLFKNYIIIFVIAIITFFLSQVIVNYILDSIVYRDKIMEIYHPKNISDYHYENMPIEQLKITNSWIEVLDEKKRVIDVKGKKKDDIYQYDERLLFDYAAQHDYSEEYPYYYNIYPIDGPNDEPYLLIWKLPKNMYSMTYNLRLEYLTKEVTSFQVILYGTFIVVFLLLFGLSLYFYSKFTSKYIRTPIIHLMNGIREMEKQNYNTRLNFYAQNEFGEIRDAFNNMAERLENIEKEKRSLTESKQRMLVDISHDLKTPITSIYGFSKLLYDEDIKSEIDKKKYLNYIYNKSQHVSNLIQDLFQLSRLDDESFEFSYKLKNFAEWLRLIINEFYTEFEKKGFILRINIIEEPIMLEFDEKQIYRAISNILINTLKYTPTGTKVWIDCYRVKGKIILKVEDNGIGIQEELKNTIFDPFVRGDKSRKSEDGTGLGLAITKKIIERHNGIIIHSSNEKANTIFTIKLPIYETVDI